MATQKSKRKILIFSTAYYPFVGGAEVAVKEITDRLTKRFECDLITARFDSRLSRIEKIGNVTVYRVGFGSPAIDKLLLPFWGAFRAFRLAQHTDYFCFWAVMVSWGSGAAYVSNMLRKISGKKRIPIILNLQEGDSESHLKYKWFGLINLSWKLALQQTSFLTGLSNFLIHRAEKMGYTGKKALIPNGVNVKVFSRRIVNAEKEAMRLKLGKNPDDVFLVTTSRLSKKNAVDDVILSLAYLPKNVYFLIIGRGEEGHRLEELARETGVSDRVKFLGFIPHQEIPVYFSVCDIFIRPSRSEGFGNSFIEAMASRLPVIATPVGGIPDFLDDKQTGLFCSPDNPKSIAEAVSTILEDVTLRNRIIQNGYNRVVDSYEWSKIASDMETKVFDRLGK